MYNKHAYLKQRINVYVSTHSLYFRSGQKIKDKTNIEKKYIYGVIYRRFFGVNS